MLESNKFADILGVNFSCQADPPVTKCPMELGTEEPVLEEEDGSYLCPLCFKIVGQESSQDEDVVNDDVIDEEESMALDINYVPETDRIQKDLGKEGQRDVSRKETISEITSIVLPVDRAYVEYMSDNQDSILTMLSEVEEAELKGFEIGTALKPKILAVTSHLFKRLPNSSAFELLSIRPARVSDKKKILDELYSTKIGNKVSVQINVIGNSLEIPQALVSKAIEMYEKETPANREPKDRVKAAAWLYTYLTKKSNLRPKKGDFTKLPEISRVSFGKSVSVYSSYF